MITPVIIFRQMQSSSNMPIESGEVEAASLGRPVAKPDAQETGKCLPSSNFVSAVGRDIRRTSNCDILHDNHVDIFNLEQNIKSEDI